MGRLIVFDGIYSAGKSTQITRLARHLRDSGEHVVVTEWNSSPVLADSMLMWRTRRELVPDVLFLLEVADFAHRLRTVVEPALRAGHTVIADRYVYTAIARGTVRGLPLSYCAAVCAFAPRPDLVYHLTVPVATTLDRRLHTGRSIADYVSGSDFLTGGTDADRFLRYQALLQDSYSHQLTTVAHAVDGARDRDQVWAQVLGALSDLLIEGG